MGRFLQCSRLSVRLVDSFCFKLFEVFISLVFRVTVCISFMGASFFPHPFLKSNFPKAANPEIRRVPEDWHA
jgi:hypothetical protein